jgi:hypothetical protein
MAERIGSGPHAALGIDSAATPGEIRTAFLELTKTYHPARFGRMSPETQRFANEVFLGLRAAHETLAKPARAPTQQMPRAGTGPIATVRQTGAVPTLARPAVGSAGISRPTQSLPVQSPPSTVSGSGPRQSPIPARTTQPLPPQRTQQIAAQQAPARPTPQPPSSALAQGTARPTPPHVGTRPMPTSRPPTNGTAQPAVSTSTVKFARPGDAPRPGETQPTPRPLAPGTSPPPGGADPQLVAILDLLAKRQWDTARTQLDSLASKHPGSARHQAVQAYARGRRAQVEQRLDEARIELDRALQLDPDLQPAKAALAELFTRRR